MDDVLVCIFQLCFDHVKCFINAVNIFFCYGGTALGPNVSDISSISMMFVGGCVMNKFL